MVDRSVCILLYIFLFRPSECFLMFIAMNGLLKLFQGSIILELLKSLVKFIGTIIIQQHIRYSSFPCQRPNRYELFRLTPFALLCFFWSGGVIW